MKQITLILDKNKYIAEFFKQMQENSIITVRDMAGIPPKTTYYKKFLPKLTKLNMCAERLGTWLFKLEMQYEDGRAQIVVNRNPNLKVLSDLDFIVVEVKDE